jgi:hypothetical protein
MQHTLDDTARAASGGGQGGERVADDRFGEDLRQHGDAAPPVVEQVERPGAAPPLCCGAAMRTAMQHTLDDTARAASGGRSGPMMTNSVVPMPKEAAASARSARATDRPPDAARAAESIVRDALAALPATAGPRAALR